MNHSAHSPSNTRPWPHAAGKVMVAIAAVAAVMAIAAIGSGGSAPAPASAAVPGGPSAVPTAAGLATLDLRFEAARAEHDVGHYPEAFAALAMLADEGHCEAARLALQMVRAGPSVNGISLRAGPKQLARWGNLQRCIPGAPLR